MLKNNINVVYFMETVVAMSVSLHGCFDNLVNSAQLQFVFVFCSRKT